jgi:hypothetical protein
MGEREVLNLSLNFQPAIIATNEGLVKKLSGAYRVGIIGVAIL